MRLLVRAGLYLGVLVTAVTLFVGSLDFSIDQTVRHIAESRGQPMPARLRPSYIAPTPVLTAKEFASVHLAPVSPSGEAAKAEMGIAAVDPMTTGSVSGQVATSGPVYRVTASGLNVRLAPNKRSAKVLVLKSGEQVQVAETQRSWVRVVRGDGQGGWVSAKYLVPVE